MVNSAASHLCANYLVPLCFLQIYVCEQKQEDAGVIMLSHGRGLNYKNSRGEVNSYHKPCSGYYSYVTVSHIQLETTYPIVAMFVQWHKDMMPHYFGLLCDIYNAPGRYSHNHNTRIMVLHQYVVLQLPDIIQPQFQSRNLFN